MATNKIGKKIAEIGKGAKDAVGNTKDLVVDKIDKNDDGKVSVSDVAARVGDFGGALKEKAQRYRETVSEKNRQKELEELKPIFPNRLTEEDFSMSRFVRIVPRDKKHAASKVCEGSIGYMTEKKRISWINIFSDSVCEFGLSFYPDSNQEFYFVDPFRPDLYIETNGFFDYQKDCIIAELDKVAQDLGAKHFRVTMVEQVEKSLKIDRGVKAKIDENVDAEEKMDVSLEYEVERSVLADSGFAGRAPVRPELRYLANNPNIVRLVDARLDEHSPLTYKKYTVQLSKTLGVSVKEALLIDAVVKKISGNAKLSFDVATKMKAKTYFEYELE